MVNEEREDRDSGSLLPIILGVGAVAILATQIQGGGFVLSGYAACRTDSPTNQQVHLTWGNNGQDQDYDILRDGVTIDTVRGTQWNSTLMPLTQQGRVYRFQVIGVESGRRTNEIGIDVYRCDLQTGQTISAVNVVFS